MALFLGFDPGGTGKKWSYVCATADGSDDLFAGCIREPGVKPSLTTSSFPYLDKVSIASIENGIKAVLHDLLEAYGASEDNERDLLSEAVSYFDQIIVAVDSPSGFAVSTSKKRDTESRAGRNFYTPDEDTFLKRACKWEKEGNTTPLHQRIYWKLVGFTIYRFFTGATKATDIAAIASSEIASNFSISIPTAPGLWILESFPSDTYKETTDAHFLKVADVAARDLKTIPSCYLSKSTFNWFNNTLVSFEVNDRTNWARFSGRRGDILDAFSCMMLGVWGRSKNLKALGSDIDRIIVEGAIVVPHK